jgi:hypothetical protein
VWARGEGLPGRLTAGGVFLGLALNGRGLTDGLSVKLLLRLLTLRSEDDECPLILNKETGRRGALGARKVQGL